MKKRSTTYISPSHSQKPSMIPKFARIPLAISIKSKFSHLKKVQEPKVTYLC